MMPLWRSPQVDRGASAKGGEGPCRVRTSCFLGLVRLFVVRFGRLLPGMCGFQPVAKFLLAKVPSFALPFQGSSIAEHQLLSINRCQVSAPGRVPWTPVVVHGCAVPRGVVIDYPCIHRVYPYHCRQRAPRQTKAPSWQRAVTSQ